MSAGKWDRFLCSLCANLQLRHQPWEPVSGTSAAKHSQQRMIITYDSVSPVLRYDSGLLYGQALPQKARSRMARAKSGVHLLTGPALMQFLQNIITAATGNPNAPTPTP